MIKVCFKTENQAIKSFEMKGHANQDTIGKDLVCAGASSIGVGILNALDILTNDGCYLAMSENEIKVEVLDMNDNKIQTILEVAKIQLETIEEQYPQNIKIEMTEV